MTRTELIDALAAETNTERKDSKAFLEALTADHRAVIKDGGEVPLKGLGKFKVQNRKARVGRNPLTGDAGSDSGQDGGQVHGRQATEDLIAVAQVDARTGHRTVFRPQDGPGGRPTTARVSSAATLTPGRPACPARARGLPRIASLSRYRA